MKKITKKKLNKKRLQWLALCCVLVLMTLAAVESFAYFASRTMEKNNTFEPGEVSCEVIESFDGETKSNVTVSNTGNADAYIRATIVATWVSKEGVVYGTATPTAGEDYLIKLGTAWTEKEDGYFYYEGIVPPGDETPMLIERCEVIHGNAPEGYYLSIEIVASAVQANPNKTLELWGVKIQ